MANKRLIDANALFDKLKKLAELMRQGKIGEIDLNLLIASTPTVDAVEVVYGKWEDEYGGKYANPRYRCSACKERALYKFERDLLGNWKKVQALTPNCPHCAARMDGEK